ncbi:LPS export ABC transporter permease LptG [Salinisphaera sp. USBA-960]|uniref:LPS export ABC transporter permease LptG n=1 Tax=Salinisphaera orenii TaxID=856731 RepID=UPI0013A64EA4|nr:LPS export ABC transporter permease LptG [Salifodinibacter halophilus]NNC25481.1 LPS export ABC transporter permease LptG [Salifodinibacter halophilus]
MTLIDRYIARTIFAATAVVAVVIIALMMLIGVINQLDEIGQGNYHVIAMLGVVMLQLPSRILLTLPAIVLLGALAGLGSLASHSELIVIRGAGLSMRRLAGSVAIIGAILAAITLAISTYIAPRAQTAALSVQHTALNGGENSGALGSGIWLRQKDKVFNFGHVLPDGRLTGIHVYQFDSGGGIGKIVASDKGRVKKNQLVLDNPRITKLSTQRVTTEHPDRRAMPVTIDQHILKLAVTAPSQLTIVGLHHYIQFLEANDVDATRYRLAFWQQVATPITAFVLAIFALPFAFGALRDAGAGQRLFIGGLGGLAFVLLHRIVAAMAPVYGVWPPLAALLPTLVLASATAIWIRRLD